MYYYGDGKNDTGQSTNQLFTIAFIIFPSTPPPPIYVWGSGKASDNMARINIAWEERDHFLLN